VQIREGPVLPHHRLEHPVIGRPKAGIWYEGTHAQNTTATIEIPFD
jgi:hypothetical protein